jgi:hypothetical protein
MNTKETIKATGHISFKLYDANGEVKDSREISNVVVTVGKNFMAAWLAAASQAAPFMNYIGLGTGIAAANASDTDLGIPLATRVAGTLTSAANVWQNVALFGPGVDTGAVTESGIFSASVAGTMFARQTFAVINKGTGDSLSVTWQITLS